VPLTLPERECLFTVPQRSEKVDARSPEVAEADQASLSTRCVYGVWKSEGGTSGQHHCCRSLTKHKVSSAGYRDHVTRLLGFGRLSGKIKVLWIPKDRVHSSAVQQSHVAVNFGRA
jgi:hypothetical protein